jgi:type IV secretory pathway TraG/TraD family ATPase VirD4
MSYKKALDADKQIKFLAKLDKKINFLINAIAPVPDNAGTNSFFYEQARVYLIGFIYLFLEINTNVDDFNLFNIASNVKLIAKKIGIIYDNLSAFSLCKKYLKDFSYDDMHLGNQTTSQDSVLSMVNNYLSPFLNQNIRMATLFSEIDFRYFVDGRAIVYVQVEATSSKDSPTNKLSILFMNNLYDFLNDYLNDNQISSFKNSVLYIIDEFGNMPRMEFISKIFSLDRAKNIFAIISVQSKSQILEIYGPHRTQELIDSAQCLIICSLDDVNFAQELSRRSGKVIRKSYSISEQESGKDEEFTKSKTQSESESQVEAIEAHEFINKKQNEFIIFLRGISPIKIEFIPF